MKNIGNLDKSSRSLVGLIAFLAAFFWLGGVWQIILYIVAIIMFGTAITAICPLYVLLHINTTKEDLEKTSKKAGIIFSIIFLVILIGGAYASNFFSKKFFVEDFNAMNKHYKQALFETGQEKRPEAISNYDLLVVGFANFQKKYSNYQPYVLHSDKQFVSDLEKIEEIITNVKQDIYTADLKTAHLALEQVRPITQEMFKRNGFSMLAIALVDFHDSMEKVLDAANAKDTAGVTTTYAEADSKLAVIEKEANDGEIQAIRNNLDAILKLAKDGNLEALSAKAAELKSSFVKVYLKRG